MCVCVHAGMCVYHAHPCNHAEDVCESEGRENGCFSSSLTGYEERYSGAGRSDCSQQV